MWQELSSVLNYGSVLDLLSKFLFVSTPGKCLWAGDLGEELNLLATILDAKILLFQKWTEDVQFHAASILGNLEGYTYVSSTDTFEIHKPFHRHVFDIRSWMCSSL